MHKHKKRKGSSDKKGLNKHIIILHNIQQPCTSVENIQHPCTTGEKYNIIPQGRPETTYQWTTNLLTERFQIFSVNEETNSYIV